MVKGVKKVVQVLEKLSVWEKLFGSYVIIIMEFYGKNVSFCDVLVYMVIERNFLYVGFVFENEDIDLECIVDIVVWICGIVGLNLEYVIWLVDYIWKYILEERDEYLFNLDNKIRNKIIYIYEYRYQGQLINLCKIIWILLL